MQHEGMLANARGQSHPLTRVRLHLRIHLFTLTIDENTWTEQFLAPIYFNIKFIFTCKAYWFNFFIKRSYNILGFKSCSLGIPRLCLNYPMSTHVLVSMSHIHFGSVNY